MSGWFSLLTEHQLESENMFSDLKRVTNLMKR